MIETLALALALAVVIDLTVCAGCLVGGLIKENREEKKDG
jgi:hypothetical protein